MADKGSPGLRLEAMFAVIRRTQCSNRKTGRLVAFGSSMVAQSSYENPVVRWSPDSVPRVTQDEGFLLPVEAPLSGLSVSHRSLSHVDPWVNAS